MSKNVYSTVEEAIVGEKLDKRRKYHEYEGGLFCTIRYTAPCSGCSCDCSDGYGCSHGASGCKECGYSGKARQCVPVPVFGLNDCLIKIKKQIMSKLSKLNTYKDLVVLVNELFEQLEITEYVCVAVKRTYFTNQQYEAGACYMLIIFDVIEESERDANTTGYFMCFYPLKLIKKYLKEGYKLYIKSGKMGHLMNDLELDVKK